MPEQLSNYTVPSETQFLLSFYSILLHTHCFLVSTSNTVAAYQAVRRRKITVLTPF